jgi:YHS domain-containing protein
MISVFLRELVVPLLLFWLLRSLLVNAFSRRRRPASPATNQSPARPATPGGTLHKDPVCGTYVSGDSAITLTVKGEKVYFCSRDCCDKFHSG